MNSPAHRRCPHCLQSFVPDYRNAYHQRFCSEPACRQASKRASQRRWLRKPRNRNYFREPDNVSRVREWRRKHPGYWRSSQHRYATVPLTGPPQAPAAVGASRSEAGTLQDACRSKTPVLTGILRRLSCCTLQEDIAHCAREMLSEAQCILLLCQSSLSPPSQTGGSPICHETG
jgi:hypothetical protein